MSNAIRTPSDEVPNGVKIRLEAWVKGHILDQGSLEVVGWLYEWNTGEREPMWKNGQRDEVIYELRDQRQ